MGDVAADAVTYGLSCTAPLIVSSNRIWRNDVAVPCVHEARAISSTAA